MKASNYNTIELNAVVHLVQHWLVESRREPSAPGVYVYNAEVAVPHLRKHFVVAKNRSSRELAETCALQVIQPMLDEVEATIWRHLDKFPVAKE